MTTCYLAIGSTYTADGWTLEGPLFSVLIPSEDREHAIDYARRHANRGPDGLAMHGAENVTRVESVSPERRRPCNAKETAFPIFLPPAPDHSRWQIVSVAWEQVALQRLPHVAENMPAKIYLRWPDLRAAAADNSWYRDLLRRCEAASY